VTADKAQTFDTRLLWPNGQTGPWILALRFRLDALGFRCIAASLGPVDETMPLTLTSTALRDLPLANITRDRAKVYRGEFALSGHEDLRDLSSRLTKADRPRARTTNFYRDVARVYKRAQLAGQLPTKAVAMHFGVSNSQAATWVRRARIKGLIPPAPKQGKWR
jgi:hypothetical protein